MDRSRDYSWTVRLITVAGMILFAALFLGAQRGWASPAAPVGPAEITVATAPTLPTVVTLPPKPPKPCLGTVKCLPPLQPCFTIPGHTCQPPTLEPCLADCQPPTSAPKTPTSEPRTPTTTPGRPTPQATPNNPPSAIPTPNRIDTGGGPATAAASADAPDWVYWVLPGLVLLVLAGGAGGFWLVRSEARR
ncbi:MAG: hypothetical protein ACJ72N_26410 [Labedaea sp.]